MSTQAMSPGIRRDSLSWIAAGFIAVWSLLGLIYGGYDLVEQTIGARALSTSELPSIEPRVGVSIVLFAVWVLSLNLVLPGLVMGVIAVARQGPRRVGRAIAFVVLVVGGVVAEFWAAAFTSNAPILGTDFMRDGRFSSLLVILIALLVAAGSAALLGLFGNPGRTPPPLSD